MHPRHFFPSSPWPLLLFTLSRHFSISELWHLLFSLPAMLFPIQAHLSLHSGPCSNATSSDRLLLLSMSKAASSYPFCLVLCFSYIRNFIMTSHYRIFYMRQTRGVVISTDWGTKLRLYSSFTTSQLCSLRQVISPLCASISSSVNKKHTKITPRT